MKDIIREKLIMESMKRNLELEQMLEKATGILDQMGDLVICGKKPNTEEKDIPPAKKLVKRIGVII